MDDEIELKVVEMSSMLHPAQAYALLLQEKNGKLKLPIIIGALEAQSIKLAMMNLEIPRPLTHDLIITLLQKLNVQLEKVLIYKVKDGVFYSYLSFYQEGKVFQLDSRTSDAIALALRLKVPIYTYRSILENDSITEDENGKVSVNINTIDMASLKKALKKAISAENYELASTLRDEIKRREEESSQNE